MNEKVKTIAKKRGAVHTSWGLALIVALIGTASTLWPTLQEVVGPVWYFVGAIAFTGIGVFLNRWQKKQ